MNSVVVHISAGSTVVSMHDNVMQGVVCSAHCCV